MRASSKYSFILLVTLLIFPIYAGAQTGLSVRSDIDQQLYTIDLQTGDAEAIGPTGFEDIECLTFNLVGDTLFGADDGGQEGPDLLVTCDPNSGACTEVGPLNIEGDIGGLECGLTFDCNGNLFLSIGTGGGENATTFYSVDPDTGQASVIGPQGQAVTGLSARRGDPSCPSGIFGLGVDEDDLIASLGCMDINTGEYREIGPLVNEDILCGGIGFDENGQILWGINDGDEDPADIFTINPETGEAIVITQTLIGFESLAIAPPFCGQLVRSIPTLSEWGLTATVAILGIAGLMFIYFRIRKVTV